MDIIRVVATLDRRTTETRLPAAPDGRKPWIRPKLVEHAARTEGGSIGGASDVSVFNS